MTETMATYLPTGCKVGVTGLRGARRADLVVLPRRAYDALARRLEDAEDRAVLRAAIAAPEARDYLPAEAVARLVAGAHPVRVWREHRGFTVRRLAALAGLDVGYVSSIETGKKPGSLRAFKSLAEALGVELGDLT